MLTADVEERSSEIMDELFGADGECDDVRLDLDFFRRLMGGPASPSQGNTLLDIFPIDVPQGVHNSKDLLSPNPEIPEFGVLSSSHNSEASGSGIGSSDGSSESAGTSSVTVGTGVLKPSSHFGILENSSSRTLSNCVSVQENSLSHICMVGGPQTPSSYCQNDGARAPFGTPNHRGPFCSYATSHVTHDGKYSAVCHMNNDKDLFGCSRLDFHFGNTEDALVIDGDRTSQEASYTESNSCEINMADAPVFSPEHSDMYLFGSHDLPYIYFSPGFQSLAWDGSTMVNTVVNNMGPSADLAGTYFGHQMLECGNAGPVSLQAMQDEPKTLSSDALSCIFSKTGDYIKVEENVESVTSSEIVSKASEVVDDKIRRRYCESESKLPSTEGMQGSSSDSFALVSCKKYVSCRKDEKENLPLKSDFIPQGMIGEINPPQLAVGAYDCGSALQVSGQPGMWPLASLKADMNLHKGEYEVSKFNSYLSNFYQEVQHNKLEHSNFNGDSDVCILEGIPAVTSDPETLNGKLFAASQISTLADPNGHMVMGHSKLRPDDERVIFRVAVQDLSQPKSEAIPPDGVLAVPLMKHQRIALSWMINKETKGECCSGGILADDQGLGKTVSTIALILTERPPSSKAPIANKEQCQKEMFDLNEDNGASETYYMEDPREVNGGKTYLKTKGRPSAGTLIVCPTSVLRQWSEELHNKVTREADLSVLVYHGSSRTKDPLDLAQYDVVITTYAIVSKEVENQTGVNEDDDPTGTPLKGDSSTKKRKILQTASCKKSSRTKKSNKEIDNELLETISGPLAEVGWFRVVLDEAQTIKNHKTLVARACWGLRAKRRWCLSGTPIQNAIDDLYSYFRFLRHDPYATFQIFLENIKSPIQKNPVVGYRKLQAVLKTIMLRRTKGTCIDGEPIVNLPPKTIELKRVDFSIEERDFYCRLEADSQAQFAEYAKAGTVKQNYVNILLMLLRLRQACNHPLLVRGLSSTLQTASSIEMAKKLPPEKTIVLLNCLEASLAICGICRDPPEDAVVTLCGHVFCNQCILLHMNGDEKNCPNKSCKAHLTPSNIFSITTLHGAISESLNPHINHTSDCSDSELAKPSESCTLSSPEGSSKIKAALKLLTSLSKPHDPSSVLTSLKPTAGCYGCDSVVENGTKEIKDDSYNPVMGEKAIVFSQWTRMLDFLEDRLKNSSIQYRRLDGTMPIAARDRAVKDFTTLSQVTVMIMSLKAASLGLNVVAACHVILLDLWWSPTTEDQAIDRAHRIGQTRPVSVYRLTVRDTVEDRILALQERKRQMVASAFGEDEAGNRQTRLTVDDLKYLFRVD